MTNNRALGRGLEQLFNSDSLDINAFEEKIINDSKPDELVHIKLKDLRSNPYQPRKIFDETALNELSKSIEEHGVFQPIIVKKSIKGYEIIAGERRVKASRLAGKETIPAIIRDFNDEEMMQIALLENLQRENLNAIEEAQAYKNIIEKMNLTQDELAKKLGKSRSHITNMIGILRLTSDIQNYIMENKISMGHARVLSKLDDENKIKEYSLLIISHNLSVRDLEKLVSGKKTVKNKKTKTSSEPEEYKFINEDISDFLGTKTVIKDKKIEIYFNSVNDLNRLIELIKE